MTFLWSKVEIMTGDVHNHLHDIHTVEYSTPTKIKILKVFNDMEKCYIILSEKGRIQNCIFTVVIPLPYICLGKCQKEIHQNVSYFWVMESLVIFKSSSYFSLFSIM